MEKNLTLVIMAAGMGARFGGLKQIEPIGPNGEFIIDYSVYDAIKAGFNKVVFIIKEENFEVFKETIGARISDKIAVEYAFQSLDDIPGIYDYPSDRKPWGTGHALRAVRDIVNEPHAVIGSDDFFGSDAFIKFAEFLKNECNEDTYASVAYKVLNTVSEHGTVNRGVMFGENGVLKRIVESTVGKVGDHYTGAPHNGEPEFDIDENTRATMLTYAFHPSFLKILDKEFSLFIEENKDDLEKCEFYIPNVVQKLIDNNEKTVLMIDTSATWHGLTHKDDLEPLRSAIKNYHDNGEYPSNLWG